MSYNKMETLIQFKTSINAKEPDPELAVQLKALWYDGKGNWNLAHQQVDQLSDRESAWVHAYLHRKEGDTGNADYWYQKSGKVRPDISLAQEWEALVLHFLQ
jgi:hypothetical protein